MDDSAIAPGAPSHDPGNGIVWAFRFEQDGVATPLGDDAIDAALASPAGWVWLHFALADARARNWIATRAPVSAAAREALLGQDEHLHLDVVGREIIGNLPDLQRELGHEGEGIGRLRLVMTDRLLISARRKPLHAVELTRRAIESGQRFAAAITLVDAIMDQFADASSNLAQRLGDELDEVENRLTQDTFNDEGRALGRVRLRTARVQRQLNHVRSLFHRLEPRLPSDANDVATAVRSLTLKLNSVEHEMAAVYERAHLLHDELGAKTSAITNRRLFTLAVLNACLLPPTLVSGGFFGMNTADLPLHNIVGGSWYAALIAIASGAITYLGLRLLRAL